MSELDSPNNDQTVYEENLHALIFDALQTGNPLAIMEAMEGIVREREMRAVPPIIRLLENSLAATDSLAVVTYPILIQTLGMLGDDLAVPVLEKIIRKDIDYWFHEEIEDYLEPAVIALTKLGRPGLLALARLYADPHPGFQHWVGYALDGKPVISTFTSEPLPLQKAPTDRLTLQYLACLDEPDPTTRLGVVKALKKLNNPETIVPLKNLLETETDNEVKKSIIGTLKKLQLLGG